MMVMCLLLPAPSEARRARRRRLLVAAMPREMLTGGGAHGSREPFVEKRERCAPLEIPRLNLGDAETGVGDQGIDLRKNRSCWRSVMR